jgi:hypothetical protein
MAFPPRRTAGRRRKMTEGRKRLVALAASGTLLIAGGSIPLAAGSEQPAACEGQPAGTTLVVDGQQVVCQGATTGEQTGTQTDQGPADQQSGDPPAAEGGDQAGDDGQQPAVTDPAPGDMSAAPAGSDVPSPQGDNTPGAPPEPQPTTAPQSEAPATDAGPASSEGTTPTAPNDQAAPPTAERRAERTAGDHRRTDRRRHTAERGAADPERHEDDHVRGTAHADSPRRDAHEATTAAAPSFDALPAAWTSLDPIVLPPFSPADFPVPMHLLPVYQAAGAEYGVPWEVLAAINEIETGYGENAGVSSAGAVGFMQFLPSTWEEWGRDADGDRRRDPRNPVDAIFSAARYLHAAGAADDLPRAIFAYDHADWYVERVVTRARELAGLDPDQVAALTDRALREYHDLYEVDGSPFFGAGSLDPTPGEVLLMSERQLTRLVLDDQRIGIYACGREDIEAGRIDRRVLATLMYLATSGLHPQVSSLECGHGRLTTSGNVSAHSYGNAVDIATINGTPIVGHQGPGTVTDEALQRLVQLQGVMRPNQIISLMTVIGANNTLAMADHNDHIHVGFPRDVRLPEGA